MKALILSFSFLSVLVLPATCADQQLNKVEEQPTTQVQCVTPDYTTEIEPIKMPTKP
jgi:hypothetical protein